MKALGVSYWVPYSPFFCLFFECDSLDYYGRMFLITYELEKKGFSGVMYKTNHGFHIVTWSMLFKNELAMIFNDLKRFIPTDFHGKVIRIFPHRDFEFIRSFYGQRVCWKELYLLYKKMFSCIVEPECVVDMGSPILSVYHPKMMVIE